MNLVIGGSPLSGKTRHSASHTAPATRAVEMHQASVAAIRTHPLIKHVIRFVPHEAYSVPD
jgi:hypothetical protein